MATPAERMRAHRERARHGLRRFTISVSADDLRARTRIFESRNGEGIPSVTQRE
jgi:hypothetical protein